MNRSQVTLPGAALFFCVVGILGLFLPLGYATVAGSIGGWPLIGGLLNLVNGSVFERPLLGILLLVVFLGLTALPVLDLRMGVVQWTERLLVPALIGFLPTVGLVVAVTWFGSWIEDWVGANFAVLGIGAGGILLLIADLGLIGTGAAATFLAAPEPLPILPPPPPPPPQRRQQKKGPDPDL